MPPLHSAPDCHTSEPSSCSTVYGPAIGLAPPLQPFPGMKNLDKTAAESLGVLLTLKAIDEELGGLNPGAVFEAIRTATQRIGRLPANSATALDGKRRLQLSLAAFTGATGDVAGHAAVLKTAVRMFLSEPFEWAPEYRLRLATEVAHLLSHAGAGNIAACVLSRVIAWADQHTKEPQRIATRLLRAEIALHTVESAEPQQHASLVRLSDADARLPRLTPHMAPGLELTKLKQLARAASRCGQDDLIGRANLLVEWAEYRHGGKLDRVVAAAKELDAIGRDRGPWFLRDTARLELCHALAASRRWTEAAQALQPRGDAPAQMPDWLESEQNFLNTAIALHRNEPIQALSSYGRYAQIAFHLHGLRERLIQSGIQAAAVLAASLPTMHPAGASKGIQNAIAVCASTIRIHISAPALLSLTEVAATQGVTVRRIQQAFKLLGLPTPVTLLGTIAQDIPG